ncbi:Diuretic hormone receptor, partial [Armadillidium nasatum]
AAVAEMENDYDQSCTLFIEDILDWIIRVPVLIVLTINILFLARIMWVLITKLRSANNVETQRYWKATKALLVLIPLLGLTYMLLIALPQKFEFFRAVLLSTQGFWVAVFYCFLNSEVRNSIRHHIERWRTERGIAHSRGTSMRHFKDSSPKTRSERFSHYGRKFFGCKRESLVCSEVTTMTTFVTNGYNSQTTSAPLQSNVNYQGAASSLQVSSHPRSSSQLSLTLHAMGGSQTASPISASTALLASTDSQEAGIKDAAL